MSLNLKEWLETNHEVESRQKLFYNMSRTMNYIHDRDYYIKSFNLKEIEILNPEKLSPIRYDTVVRMPKEYKDQIIREDIYNLAFIQISAFANIKIENLKPIYLKENFSEFQKYLPQMDVPYLQGIIERGAGIYYYEYIDKRNKQELERLQRETDSEINDSSRTISNSLGIQKTKTTAVGKSMVDSDTKKLYGDLVDTKQAAFVSFLIFPVSLILLGVILVMVVFFYI